MDAARNYAQLPESGPIYFSTHIERRGTAVLARVREAGGREIVSKRAFASYRGERTNSWLQMKCRSAFDPNKEAGSATRGQIAPPEQPPAEKKDEKVVDFVDGRELGTQIDNYRAIVIGEGPLRLNDAWFCQCLIRTA